MPHPVAEAIADAAHGQDLLRLARLVLDLLAQVTHVHVDRPRLAVVGAARSALEQLPARVDAPGFEASRASSSNSTKVSCTGSPRPRRCGGQVDLDVAAVDRLLAVGRRGAASRARRRTARTRLRNSRIRNGFVM